MTAKNYRTIVTVGNAVLWGVLALFFLGMIQAGGGNVEQDVKEILSAFLDVGEKSLAIIRGW